MAEGNYIEAVGIIQRLEGGMTRPFLCRASNGKHYVAKGLELPPAERIAELLYARLAAAFGLPIPEHGYIYIDPALLRYNPEAHSDLGPGDSFALDYVADALVHSTARALTSMSPARMTTSQSRGSGANGLNSLCRSDSR